MPRTTRKRHPRRKLKTYRKKTKLYKKRTHRRVKRGGKYVDGFGFEMDSPKRKNNSSGSYGFEDVEEEIFTPKERKSIKRPPPLEGDFGEENIEPQRKPISRSGAIKKRISPKITRSHHPTLGQVTTFGV